VEQVDVVVVGGGQAGLAVSHELTRAGVEHVVLERGLVGQTWRDRWDSFCLVTPNWSVRLPGGQYTGDDPDGFMPKDDIVDHLDSYAASFEAPIRTGIEVRTLRPLPHGGFVVETSAGELRADRVVLCTGAYQRPYRPPSAAQLPTSTVQIDVGAYRNPSELPDGRVLIIGSGQSGCQIAEELHEAGRDVVLASGRCPWAPRRVGGKDIIWWANETGFLDATVGSLSSPRDRLVSNIVATGHGGGHDLDLRTLRDMGVTLVGHFLGATDRNVRFAQDLAESVAWGDSRYRALMDLIRTTAAERGWPDPERREPEPFDSVAPDRIALKGLGAVIFAGGFRPDYRSWLPWPEAFDELGFPIHAEGASTVIEGLYFVGVHFLRKRKSSILLGVGEDAAIVAGAISGRSASPF
jgi:putative flavoprotein involved in K+ transport